jgi:transcription-repair coupling factor (superfamily II helicase)
MRQPGRGSQPQPRANLSQAEFAEQLGAPSRPYPARSVTGVRLRHKRRSWRGVSGLGETRKWPVALPEARADGGTYDRIVCSSRSHLMPAAPAREPVHVVQTKPPRAQGETRPEAQAIRRVLPRVAAMLEWPLGERAPRDPLQIANPPEGAIALLLAHWPGSAPGRSLLHVARSDTRAERIASAARSFRTGCEVLLLPPWDCLPYDRASPSRSVMGRRIGVFSRLAEAAPRGGRLVIATVESLLQRVPPRTVWPGIPFEIQRGQPIEELRVWLTRCGYILDERVDEPGEAAIRGEVVDIFPADGEVPFRLEIANGRIKRIRRYAPLDQRSTGDAEGLQVGPASEVILTESAVRAFIDSQQEAPERGILTGPTEAPQRVSGLEHHLPVCYEQLETLFDYLPDAALSLDPEIDERREAWLAQIADGFDGRVALERNGRAPGAPHLTPLEPRQLYLDESEWQGRVAQRAKVVFVDSPDAVPAWQALPRLAEAGDQSQSLASYLRTRQEAGHRILLAAPDDRAQRRLAGMVERRAGSQPTVLEHWTDVADLAPGAVGTAALDLPSGFAVPGLTVIAAGDLGVQARASTPSAAAGGEAALTSGELRPGDLVVHAEHGVGRLTGLELVEQDEAANECLSLTYGGGRKLLVPALEIDRVWRHGSEAAESTLDRLGGDGWQKRKAEVEAQLEAAAAQLLDLVKERENTSAPKLNPPQAAYRRFVARFPFTETEDQSRAIEATLADLERGAPPMDRLVCGDVGFGKTEVALRAACAAALAGKQVAVVAPTTVLVRQHLETFRRRFAGFGIAIEQLSRLSGGAGARAVRAGLADGSVRVVIGTHALASEGVRFADLGLVVIDEEQRFGAGQKERLRVLRHGVHVLTLTATPIPRTLQAALAGLMHISIIATPPVRRRPPRTFVVPFDPVIVRDALRREHQRGGQSFVVCPRIQDLEPMADRLTKIAPELDVVVAHGRMKGTVLDEIMVRFAAGGHDVLLTTDILEAGLDIPNANTMMVWRADRFGLAQLHQLRGRVGRRARQAATYLLTDPDASLAPATEQRLRTLEALEGLGAGFALGARDLDARGAGDLLGADQAGYVRLIGTELYQRLLSKALQRARGCTPPDDRPVELHLGIPVVIPSDYVPEPEVRIGLYRRLSTLASEAAVEEFGEEIADRFGSPPDAVRHLVGLARLRQRCRALGIERLEAGPKGIAVTFSEPEAAQRQHSTETSADSDLRWGGDRLICSGVTAAPEERLQAVHALLSRLERLSC